MNIPLMDTFSHIIEAIEVQNHLPYFPQQHLTPPPSPLLISLDVKLPLE